MDDYIFTTNSPYPVIGEVVLYRSTWERHIVTNHPEMVGLEGEVQNAVETPLEIYASANNPGNYSCVYQTSLSDNFTTINVAVKPAAKTRFNHGIVVTAYPLSSKPRGALVYTQGHGAIRP